MIPRVNHLSKKLRYLGFIPKIFSQKLNFVKQGSLWQWTALLSQVHCQNKFNCKYWFIFGLGIVLKSCTIVEQMLWVGRPKYMKAYVFLHEVCHMQSYVLCISARNMCYCIDLCINIIMCKRVTGCQERKGMLCFQMDLLYCQMVILRLFNQYKHFPTSFQLT